MTRRQRRMLMVVFLVAGVGVAGALALKAFQQNLLYFISPSEVVLGKAPHERLFRLGGMVKKGSVHRDKGSLKVRFVLTDFAHDVPVVYEGILPDLFREGQGVVTNGRLGPDGVFVASEVLAKHDEKYMPPEVADALKKAKTSTAVEKGSKP
jgi:cytochrome c-type biogenesis protein CcmE